MNRRKAKRLAKEIVKNQIEPQRVAADLRAEGLDIDVAFAYTGSEDLDGFVVDVTCSVCGRTARLPEASAPKPGQVALCPRCIPRR